MTENKTTQLERSEASEKIALAADFGTIYIKRTSSGEILRPIKAVMTLSQKDGQIYSFQKGKYALTAPAYVHLNKVAGVSIVTPQFIMIDGVEKHNPYVERNPRTKAIETVNVRKVGIGYNPAGNLVAIDKSLYYNIYTYLIQTIQARMKKSAWAWDKDAKRMKDTGEKEFKNMAEIGTFEDRPEEGPEAKWKFLETMDGLGIWINYRHPEVQSILEDHTQRQRFGDRIAQKIVERNILKDHPAIGVSTVDATVETDKDGKVINAFAKITVFGYRNDLSARDINSALHKAENGSDEISVRREDVVDIEPEEELSAIEEEAVLDGEATGSLKKSTKKTSLDHKKPLPEEGSTVKAGELFKGSKNEPES